MLCLRFWSSAQESEHLGSFYGHLRTFAITTINDGALSDHYALAQGAGLGYKSPSFHHFGIELNGFFIFKLASSPLHQRDQITQKLSRYELGLFDLSNPNNGKDLDRLEEVYLQYSKRAIHIKLGRQIFESSFVNPQDSRMRPGLFEGINASWKGNRTLINTAWFWASSPRSTVEWYPIKEAIGVYGMGRNSDGSPANYHQNIASKALAVFSVHYHLPKLRVHINNTLIENISNSTQVLLHLAINKSISYKVMAIKQWRVGNGGHSCSALRYQQTEQSFVLSSRLEALQGKHRWQLNTTRISEQGLFLFPREWGTEPFFTHLSRERNEGYADVWALSAKYARIIKPKHEVYFAVGYYNMPSSEQIVKSKYGLDDYLQVNAGVDLDNISKFPGCTVKSFVVLKKDLSQQNQPKYLYNLANMWQVNLVLDYHFGSQDSHHELVSDFVKKP